MQTVGPRSETVDPSGGTLLRSGLPRILCAWRATEPAYHKARTTLFDAGYSVLEVWDLTMLQRVLQERNFDLLVFDIRLPDVSFPQVVQMTGHGGRTIPIIVVSDRANAEWRWSTFDGGAYEYLVLPSEEREFLDCVNDALGTERFKSDFPMFAGASALPGTFPTPTPAPPTQATPPPLADPPAPSAVSVQHPPSSPSPSRGEGTRRSAPYLLSPSLSTGEGQGGGERLPPADAPSLREVVASVRPFPHSALPIPADPALPLPVSPKEAGDMLTMRKDISATKERERQLRIELAAKERMIKKMERFESMVIELQSENAHLKEAVARVQQESVAPTSGLSHGEQVHGSRTIPAVLILLLVFLAGGFYVWKNGIPGRKSVRTATPTVAPSLPTARIFHPTELTDVALGMAETLSNMGVQVQALEPLTNPVARTTVFYAQGKEETAHSIAGRLGPDTDLRPRDWPSGADLIIVLGEDRLE